MKNYFAIPLPWLTYASKKSKKRFLECSEAYDKALRDGTDIYALIRSGVVKPHELREHARCGLIMIKTWQPNVHDACVAHYRKTIQDALDSGRIANLLEETAAFNRKYILCEL